MVFPLTQSAESALNEFKTNANLTMTMYRLDLQTEMIEAVTLSGTPPSQPDELMAFIAKDIDSDPCYVLARWPVDQEHRLCKCLSFICYHDFLLFIPYLNSTNLSTLFSFAFLTGVSVHVHLSCERRGETTHAIRFLSPGFPAEYCVF